MFSNKLSRDVKCGFFSILLNVQIVDNKYLQGICSPTFVAERFSGLFAHPPFF